MTSYARGATVLFVCENYEPSVRAGGGARSLVNTVSLLGERFSFKVVTRNHDVGDPRPFADPPSDRWVRVGHADVYYAADRDLTLRSLLARVREADPRVIYLNSMFSVLAIKTLLLRRLGRLGGRRVVIAPEGELGAGALATRPGRKRVYLHLARAAGMFRGVLWKAASAPEAEIIRSWFGPDAPVTIAASLSAPPARGESGGAASRAIARRQPGELALLFLSRLSPKKNLLFLLDALRRTRASIHLGIAGPIADPAYWRRCEKEISRLPSNVRVTLHGALLPDHVAGLLEAYDVFALPTLDENYGYVVLEALTAGCFLLLSPHTPWSDVEREGIGRILDVADPARWAAEIDALASWPDAEFERRRGLAVDYARKRLASDEPLRQLERLLNDASSR